MMPELSYIWLISGINLCADNHDECAGRTIALQECCTYLEVEAI